MLRISKTIDSQDLAYTAQLWNHSEYDSSFEDEFPKCLAPQSRVILCVNCIDYRGRTLDVEGRRALMAQTKVKHMDDKLN